MKSTVTFLALLLIASRCFGADAVEHQPPALPMIPAKHFVITDYAGTGDGMTDNTGALQAAIDAAGKAGGGTVEVPAGEFLCGPIHLLSDVELHLNDSAVLRMLPIKSYPGGTTDPRNFIDGADLHDIAITGSGTIDGQGTDWWPFARDKTAKRPRMIALSGCNRVLIENVKLLDSPMFHIAIGGKSENITVRGVNIRANPSTDPVHPGHNTDACDVTAHHVLIKDCDVSVGDDNFTCSGGTSDVLITHCTYGYGHGVSIGSHTAGEISNITVEDCTFKNTECGIRIKSDRDRGGHVHDLIYRNLTMTDVGMPILIYGSYMATEKKYRTLNDVTADIAGSYPAKPLGERTPVYENIQFSHITATVQPGRRAGLIWGLPESPVSGVLLDHVDITADKPFGLYFARGVRVVDSKIVTPEGVNKFSTANAEVAILP
jgi:polygalacturonase